MKQLTGREDEKMDSFLRNALKEQAETLAIGPEQTERMCRGVYQRIEEEGSMRKTWNMRKTAILVAAVCLVGAMTAVAAGKNGHILLQPCGGFHGIQPAGRKGRAAGA